jgi:tetratricopeptide (TPR) repeat protein
LEPTQRPTTGNTHQQLAVGLLLVFVVALVYYPLGSHQFLLMDDMIYITENPYVQAGLTRDSLRWALTEPFFTMRIPVTLVSYLVGVELFGTDPGPMLLTNALIHALAVVLLFTALMRMTGCMGRSAFVAGVFALHPLHVESVAWASERKDVLFGLFWMVTLWAHARYAERPSLPRNALVWGAGALAMASKPMAVTLPFALLLLDAWPLGRLGRPGRLGSGAVLQWSVLGRRILEKLPLFLLSAATMASTFLTQQSAGALDAAQSIPAMLRLENALVSTVRYLGKAFWPVHLGAFYPYPESYPSWQTLSAAGLLLALSIVALLSWRRRGYLFVGWFWFVGTLVPVIGLVQVGLQAMADRYVYVPLVGISIAVSWGVCELPLLAARRRTLGTLAVAVLLALGVATSLQLRHWQDGVTLFEHTLAVTDDNPTALGNLGLALLEQGRVDEGVAALATSFQLRVPAEQLRPAVFKMLNAAGLEQQRSSAYVKAIGFYRAALAIRPDAAPLHIQLGRALFRQGRHESAIEAFLAALEANPALADAHVGIAEAARSSGQLELAVDHYREALRLQPGRTLVQDRLDGLLMIRPELEN